MNSAHGRLFIFSAPSGSGKTTIVHEVLKHFDSFGFSISATTRAPRAHEIDGKDYFFLTKEAFLAKVAAGEFLEYEEVYAGTYYGSLTSEIERVLRSGKNLLFDVDVFGGLNIKQYYGDKATAIFIQPPSVEVLRERLVMRGTETPETLAKRIAKAEHELSFAPKFDFIIVNDVLQEAVARTIAIIDDAISPSQQML